MPKARYCTHTLYTFLLRFASTSRALKTTLQSYSNVGTASTLLIFLKILPSFVAFGRNLQIPDDGKMGRILFVSVLLAYF